MTTRSAAVAAAYVDACLAELEAPKPGNVHRHAAGHGMTIDDFVQSAHVSAGVIAASGLSVGARVRGAVEATLAAVGKNTNLGIVLLCAPLAAAALAGNRELRPALNRILENLDRADATDVFAAIAAANPGGLGRAERHDVSGPADATLREAMREASDRDRIARQYVTDFEDVFSVGLPALAKARKAGRSSPAATLDVYLAYLSAFADTHIERKFGAETAEAVRREAIPWREACAKESDLETTIDGLLAWDSALKSRGINPGTSADLTVATLFASSLMGLPGTSCS